MNTVKSMKRTLPVTFQKSARGSITLEAAAAIPLFMLLCMAVLSFLLILDVQMNIQVAMEETSRSIGKKAYLLSRAEDGLNQFSEESGPQMDDADLTLMEAGINSATIKLWLLACPGLADQLNRSRIIGGAGGLYTYASSYDPSCGILDLVVQYDYPVPLLPQLFGPLRFVQRMRSHVWVGESLENKSKGGQESDSRTVYVTPTGSVYHLSESCHYLDLSIHSISASELSSKRNASGEIYDQCPECASAGHTGTVYITDYGTCWHSSLGCSALKRTIVEKDISEVGDMRMCTKCGQGSHEH